MHIFHHQRTSHFFHDVEAVEIGLLSRHDACHDQFPDDQFLSLHHYSAAPDRINAGRPSGPGTLSLGEGEGGRGGGKKKGGERREGEDEWGREGGK